MSREGEKTKANCPSEVMIAFMVGMVMQWREMLCALLGGDAVDRDALCTVGW